MILIRSGGYGLNYICKSFDELTNEQLWEIYQLRVAVFVVEQKCYYQEVDADDKTALHLLGIEDGTLISYARLIPEKDYIRIGRVVVAQSARGKNLGQDLVKNAIDAVKERFPESKQIDIQAQAYLQEFYEAFGFMATSDVYLETGIPHLDMIKKLN